MSKKTDPHLQQELETALKHVRELEELLGLHSTLIDAQNLFKITLEQMHEGLQIIDQHWRYLYVNEAVAKHGLKSKEELVGNKMTEVYPGIEKTDMFQVLKSVMESRIAKKMENLFEFPNGQKCWFELSVEPHPIGILIRSIDITEKKRIEAQYHQSQKMEAIGLLAGGIAHDFNNKLGIMMLYCEMALKQLPDNLNSIKDYIQNILTAVQDSAALTKQLLAFSRKQVLDLKVISITEMIEARRNHLERLLGENISLQFNLASDLGYIKADIAQLDQVILNLCVNAKHAMPNGGRLVVETANTLLDETYCQAYPNVIPGNYVMLSISDNGTGMPPEVKKRIFEPFFTTKAEGKGTGLGLSTVHGIIHQSRGHIWVYSEVNIGTVFKIYFPRVQDSNEPFQSTNMHISDYAGTETILLVEDDPVLRQAFVQSLQEYGYKVLAAANADEAQVLFKNNLSEIALLLTDVILPQVNGAQLSLKLKKLKADLKVIFVSGYTENSIVHDGVLDTESILIQKPVMTGTLLSLVRQVIDGKCKKGIF